jgi:methylmalonyl-CoA/ethylmalonyl-CoA epimerase
MELLDVPNIEFHHVGVATGDIDSEIEFFRILGYETEGDRFVDLLQGVTGCFMVGPGPRIELIQDTPGSETVAGLLKGQTKFYHIAYLVEDLSVAHDLAVRLRGVIVRDMLPSTAFPGKSVMFVMFRNRALIEFIGYSLVVL